MKKPVIKIYYHLGCIELVHIDHKNFKRKVIIADFLEDWVQELMLENFYKRVLKSINNQH